MKQYVLCAVLGLSGWTHAQPTSVFEALSISKQLSSECTQDDSEIFEPKTYALQTGKVTLKTYSCMREKHGKTQYYSTYAVQSASGQALYFQDQLFDAIGYVGVQAHRVDSPTLVFDNISERGGDLILIWLPDAQHVYTAKIPYLTSDEGGVDVSAQGQNILLQKKVYTGDDQKGQPKYKKIGQALVLKKENIQGFIYQSGNIKNFQQEAFK